MGKAAGERILVGGQSPQLRRPTRRSLTKAKAKAFLVALADGCNVTLAAEAAGVSTQAIYRRRATDAGFRKQWSQALSSAYSRLELMMLERALHGIERSAAVVGGDTKVMRDYSDRAALTLLKMHRDSVKDEDEGVEPADHREAMDRVLARLERMRERELETKSAPDHAALVRWALERK